MSVRYWILEDDRVEGPFAPEELRDLPHFESDSLVHPEAAEGGWVQAASVPGLAVIFRPRGGFLPPEPTLRDLTVLGGLLERTERMEEELRRVGEEAGRRDEDLLGLKAQLEAAAQESAGLRQVLEGLSERLDPLQTLQVSVSELQRSEAERGAAIEQLKALVESLTGKLGSLADASRSEEVDELRSRLALLQEEVDLMRASASSAPPEPAPAPIEPTAPEPVLAEPEPVLPEPAPEAAAAEPVIEPLMPEPVLPEPALPELALPEPVPPPIVEKVPLHRRRSVQISAAAVLLLLLLSAYFMLGRKKAPASPPPPPPAQTLAPEPLPPAPPVVEEPPPPVSAVVPKAAKKKPRPRKTAEKVLTQKQKEEQLKRDIINRIRLRMSGGSPREGLKQDKPSSD